MICTQLLRSDIEDPAREAVTLCADDLHQIGRELHSPVALLGLERGGGVVLINAHTLPADGEHALLVNVRPLQAKGFTTSQAAHKHQEQQGIAAHVFDCIEIGVRFGASEGRGLLWCVCHSGECIFIQQTGAQARFTRHFKGTTHHEPI